MSSTADDGWPSPEWLATQRDLALLMAHDLRNPIAALMANLSYLELSVAPEDREALDALDDMRRSCEQMLRMVENQVAIARLEAPSEQNENARVEVPVGDLAAQSVKRFQKLFREAGVDLAYRDESVGAVVSCDPMHFEILADNLLASVLQHVTRGGRAELVVSADTRHVIITLDDNGTRFGAPERDFSREGQLVMKSESSSRYTRGLGLYVVGLVVRRIAGRIETNRARAGGHVKIVMPRAG
jgi:signal transduction histidine kinase